ncbi:regulatory protein GemA [Clostridium amazonitimonense]|uniref:regulatory protein GemA n=1 Tax=Clostridium amazonitimonense TaxID=1499689 RepID=UPI000509EE51|nr:regulatory protein GemA [Clostridium amazonitimonense]
MQQTRYSKGHKKAPALTIRTIWGLAKGKELQLTDEDLYSIVYRETGKDSIKALTQEEIKKVCYALTALKEVDKRYINRQRSQWATQDQLWKISQIENQLGWNDNPKRLRKFMAKYYNKESLNWLTFDEASNLIESLKKVLARERKKAAAQGGEL